MGLAKGTVAETGVIEKVDMKILGEGLCVDMPNTRGPGRAVHKDQWWQSSIAKRCPADLVIVDYSGVVEDLGEFDSGR